MKNNPSQFSPRQIAYWAKSRNSWLNVIEGGKRGGKNVINVMAFCDNIEHSPESCKLFLIGGVTIATARINVLDCDGFGVYNWFSGRYTTGEYEGKTAVYVTTMNKQEKIIIVAAGGKANQERIIKGMTISSAYLTEVNELTKEFLFECLDRTISSERRRLFMDLNPKAPKHWFYSEFLDIHEQKQLEDKNYGYNYQHITIADNYSLTNDQIINVLKTYDMNSAHYRRDIKGIRCANEGLIYRIFTDNQDRFLINYSDVKDLRIANVCGGVDFGGNKSKHAFCVTAFSLYYKKVVVLYAREITATDMTPTTLYETIVQWALDAMRLYGIKALQINCDNAESTLINGLYYHVVHKGVPLNIQRARKIAVNDRIHAAIELMATDRLFYVRQYTKCLQESLSAACWDSKSETEDIRLDNGSFSVDSLDAFEYTFEQYIEQLQLTNI